MFPEDSIRAHVRPRRQSAAADPLGHVRAVVPRLERAYPSRRQAAKKHGVQMVTPRLGEVVTIGQPFESTDWWEKIEAAN